MAQPLTIALQIKKRPTRVLFINSKDPDQKVASLVPQVSIGPQGGQTLSAYV